MSLRSALLLTWIATHFTLAASASAGAATKTVSLKNKNFSPTTITVKTGDSIKFQNDDTVYHNVFSLSDANTFDLGSYGPGEFKTVKFNKSGKVMVECGVHHSMRISVNVQ